MYSQKLCTLITVAIILMPFSTSSHADTTMLPGNAENGKKLTDKYCTKCHQSEPYTSEKRKVQSVEALQKRVENCSDQIDAEITRNNAKDMVKFLNDTYYKF